MVAFGGGLHVRGRFFATSENTAKACAAYAVTFAKKCHSRVTRGQGEAAHAMPPTVLHVCTPVQVCAKPIVGKPRV